MVIPKIIFQTSKNKLEPYIVNKIMSNCYNWTYIHFTDADIINFFNDNYIEEFKDIINKFNNILSTAYQN